MTSIPTTVTFECELSVEGVTVEWLKGERAIKKSDKYEIRADGRVHRLIVKDVDDRDVGEYTAQVKNKSTTAKLIVEGKDISLDSKIRI